MKVYVTPDFFEFMYNYEQKAKIKADNSSAFDFATQEKIRNEYLSIQYNVRIIENIFTNLPCVIQAASFFNSDDIMLNEPTSRSTAFLNKILRKSDTIPKEISTTDDLLYVDDFLSMYFYLLECFDKKEFGIITKDANFQLNNFYNNANHAIMNFGGNFKDIIDLIPPTNSLLIIDKYIFGKPFQTKFEKLKQLIHLLKERCSAIDFNLTIIYYVRNGACKEPDLQVVYDYFCTVENIKFELIQIDYHNFHDRYLFTNYTLINIGLPFSDKPSTLTQFFVPSPNLVSINDRELRSYKKYLFDIRQSINDTLSDFPNQRMANADFTNRLFDHLEDYIPEP